MGAHPSILFIRDPMDNVIVKKARGGTEFFEYDHTGRASKVTMKSSDNSIISEKIYSNTYDNKGLIVAKSEQYNQSMPVHKYKPGDDITAPWVTYTYDFCDDGNIISKYATLHNGNKHYTTKYTYSAGRLVEAKKYNAHDELELFETFEYVSAEIIKTTYHAVGAISFVMIYLLNNNEVVGARMLNPMSRTARWKIQAITDQAIDINIMEDVLTPHVLSEILEHARGIRNTGQNLITLCDYDTDRFYHGEEIDRIASNFEKEQGISVVFYT